MTRRLLSIALGLILLAGLAFAWAVWRELRPVPLVQAPDAILIDADTLSVEEVVDAILARVRRGKP